MMKSSICSLLFVFFVLSLSAQDGGSFGTTSMRLQGLKVDFSNFNSEIGQSYPSLKEEIVGIGAGIGYIYERLTLGFYGTYYRGFESNNVSLKRTIFDGYGGGIGFRYVLFSKKSFQIHSLLELGVRQYNLVLSESVQYSIVDIINLDVQNFKFTNWGQYANLGVGITQFVRLPNIKLGINMSIGYRIDHGEGWKYEGINKIKDKISKMSGITGLFSLSFISPRYKNIVVITDNTEN